MAETAGLGTTMFSGHKHTNRSLPINNKICNQRWVDRCQQLHADEPVAPSPIARA